MDDRDRIALDWMQRVEGPGAQVREQDLYPRLRRWAARLPPGRRLEMGCGQGACAEALAPGAPYTGLDGSKLLIERARQIHGGPEREFVVGDAYSLPFEAGTFVGVASVALWHLLEFPHKVAQEVARVLQPGGCFLIVMANPAFYEAWTGLYSEGTRTGVRFEGTTVLGDGKPVRETLYLHPAQALRSALEGASLEVESWETFRGVAPEVHQFLEICGRHNGN